MALRWYAAGMVDPGNQFCRINSRLHLRTLRDTLERLLNRRYTGILTR